MADLIQIQYEVVDKGKSLKTALTGVERMEKSLAKLSKEIVSGTVTQDRQRKALIAYGRELKRLTGMTGTQAYGAVVKYKNALVNQTVAQNKAAIASQRLAKVQDYLATRQDRATLSAQKQNAALHQTKNTMNGSNAAIQQLGYQFGDFAVQVQGGTSAFVAFSQQGSQLAGILPMIAGPLGLSMGAAVGLSAALGILIPIGSAVGRMFFEMMSGADKAKDGILSLSDAMDKLSSSTQSYQSKLAMLEFGVDTEAEARVLQEILTKRKALVKLNEEYSTATLGRRQAISEEAKEIKTQLFDLRKIADANAEIRVEYERQAELQKSASTLVERNQKNQLNRIKEIVAAFKAAEEVRQKARDDQKAANASAEESIRLEQQKLSLMMIEEDVGKDTGEYARTAASYERENLYLKLEQAGVSETIITRAIDLLGAQQQVTAQMKASADQAERLKNNLEVASSFRVGGDMGEFADVAGGLDAFGGAGSFKYGGSQKFKSDANARKKELKDINDVIAALREQTDQETKLLGLTGERRTEEEIFYQLVQENAKADTKASKDKLRAIAKEIAAQKEANKVIQKGIDFAKDLGDAFTDFIMTGFKDFKSFVSSIGDMFKQVLAQMVSQALTTKIFMPITAGFTGTMLGSAAGGATGSMIAGGAAGGGMLAGIGAAAAGLSSGFMGIMSGGGLGASFANLGGLMSGSVSGLGAIGAALPALAAVAVVVGLLTKKTKLLDSGLRATIEGFDVAIETFKLTQSSRLFGLLKGSKKLRYEAASAEVADPLIEAIGNMQQSIVDAAGTLGIGADAFDDFSYQFKLSLRGLTEEQQLEKINKEINKMGDSFASLTGHFETMNELLAAANQRMQLQNRLDQLLGNNQAILTRQREAELLAMHELNRPLAKMIYNLEDAQFALAQADQAVGQAFAGLSASIEAEKNSLRDAFTSIVDGLKERLDVANETMSRSSSIYSMLESAVSGRSIASGISQSLSRREGALGFIRGGDFSDERKLEEALDVVAEPSEDLFSSFVDYARDFSRTSITLEEAKKLAQVQLTADEKSVLLLEEQIAQAQVDLDAQLEALDKQYQMQVDQYNALLGIDASVKSVTEAIGTLKSATAGLSAAQADVASASNAAKVVASAGASAGLQMTDEKFKGFDLARLRGSEDLLVAAAKNNVQISGKTGQQIQQALANATGLAISLDNATRAKGFAQGGYHTGGLRMVGERGPELEATGPSRIFSHNQTSGMFKDPDLKEAVNDLRREVSGLRSEQRQMQASNAKYVKRNYDINRKWDVDGLPATRT